MWRSLPSIRCRRDKSPSARAWPSARIRSATDPRLRRGGRRRGVRWRGEPSCAGEWIGPSICAAFGLRLHHGGHRRTSNWRSCCSGGVASAGTRAASGLHLHHESRHRAANCHGRGCGQPRHRRRVGSMHPLQGSPPRSQLGGGERCTISCVTPSLGKLRHRQQVEANSVVAAGACLCRGDNCRVADAGGRSRRAWLASAPCQACVSTAEASVDQPTGEGTDAPLVAIPSLLGDSIRRLGPSGRLRLLPRSLLQCDAAG